MPETDVGIETSFENLCRVCSNTYEKRKLIPVFKNENVLEKITMCLPITIHLGDKLPHQVCESCLKGIDRSFELINKSQSSEKYFFSILEKIQDGSIQIEEVVADEAFDNKIHSIKLETPNKQPVLLDLDGTITCDLCGMRLSETQELNNHIHEKHIHQAAPPSVDFVLRKICSLCGQLFDSEENYELHKCETQQKCCHCKKILPTSCLLNRHIQHACKPLHFCPHCHKTFLAKSLFLSHVQIHSEHGFPIDCLACEKKNEGSGMRGLVHSCGQILSDRFPTTKKYRCYICGQGYKRQQNLARHCLQHQPKTTWKFNCVKCDEVFEKEKLLHRHYEKVHKMPRTWVCRFCGKSLSTKLSLQIHERIHTKVKPYVCEWCGNEFRCKANLTQHHAVHTGIRRHRCPVCNKMFSRPFFLQVHLRIHTGEKPYQCDMCGRGFTQLTDMKRHRIRHDKLQTRKSKSSPMVTVEEDEGNSSASEFPKVIIDSYNADHDLSTDGYESSAMVIEEGVEVRNEITIDSCPMEAVEVKIEVSDE